MKEEEKNQLEIHEKGWGYEKWIINFDLYCGKVLVFNSGKKCSWHYHKKKTETFYLQSGKLIVFTSRYDSLRMANETHLLPGESMHILPGIRHQMVAVEDSELFEFSTEHFEDDSIRLIKGD